MKVLDYLKENIIYLDGGMGTLLQRQGLKPGEYPEKWNISHPDVVTNVHKEYFDAGSNVVVTNTFGANCLKFSHEELEDIVKAAVTNAKKAASLSEGQQEKFVAMDIGPCGKLLKPYGDFEFESAVSLFKELASLGDKYGADLIFIETMSDSLETKAALLGAKEATGLPVFVSNAYDESSKLMTGASPSAMVAMLEAMGADAIGVNCSFGPDQLMDVIDEYLKYASIPVIFKPNAGLPSAVDGSYDLSPEDFGKDIQKAIEAGVRVVGGCCGTDPRYIRAIPKNLEPKKIEEKNFSLVSSYTHAVSFGEEPILIGERINPTGKKKFKEALRSGDIEYILREGIKQQEKGVHVLDVNVGLPEIDEVSMLKKVVYELQAVTDLPLQIDTMDEEAMEAALREYNGKAMVNSVSGKQESMDKVFPLVKKYGGLVVCLTLDDDGIPKTAEERVKIAEKIIAEAKKYGIKKKDLIFDTLTMAVSADEKAANVTLEALERIRNDLGSSTSLGVSNVSFGLPNRDRINASFFAMALERGLSAAIMNPNSIDMMNTYYSFKALKGMDPAFEEYIQKVTGITEEVVNTNMDLKEAVIKGLKKEAAIKAKELLETMAPLDIINNEIIPALDVVGKGFEEKKMFLPQLMMAAEASQEAFGVIKEKVPAAEETGPEIVVATVKGDIHDIGKNIVKLILENYGFKVIDLGKDVAPDVIAEKVVSEKAPLVGLSALMTTTVPAMEETVKLLREKAPWCKIVVGGAVLNEEYANMIGADYYGKDAMATVRYAKKISQ
ncbi:MAG: homocysteine S-methyltransferase family protein [Clostridia bacterium]|nr:homocysteine S-methyltransferase family protein [Clostridia bacterium]